MDYLADKIPTPREKRGYWTLVAVQMQNALNEKAAQFLLIPLAAALPASLLTGEEGFMEHLLGAIVVLPFILFSPIVGWLSDRYCKARIIQSMAFLQIIVMLAMWFSLQQQSMVWTILFFTVFAIQATILSPAKKGIVKDIVGSRQLGSASGIIEMSVVLALLIGQIGAFIWYNYLYEGQPDKIWSSASFPTLLLAATAIPVALASLLIPRYPVLERRPFQNKIFFEHFTQLAQIWKNRHLRLSALGVSFFWFFAGFMALITIQIAKEQGTNFGFNAALLMAWLSGGVVIGGALASWICRKTIELGLIPLGAFGLAFGSFGMAIFAPHTALFNACLVFAGLAGAFYLVPLNAYLQNTCKDSERGSVIAGGNLLDCLFGLIAVAIQAILKIFLPVNGQMAIIGLLCLLMTIIALRLIPREFVRLIGLGFIRLFYRPNIIHPERIPQSGGVLLLCNHVTWGDAFFVSLACPRPVRFIVDRDFTKKKWLGWFLELFNSVPISTKSFREAIQQASDAIKEGSIVCIFPEGQLSRTGCMNQLRRGFELIAKQANCPVVPMYMDGLWGSILSFSRGGFFKNPSRLPYHFTIYFDQPIDPKDDLINANYILSRFQLLSANCLESLNFNSLEIISRKLDSINNKPVVTYGDISLSGKQLLYILNTKQFSNPNLPDPLQKWIKWLEFFQNNPGHIDRFITNAIQLQHVNALQPKTPFVSTVGYEEGHEPVLAVLWPILSLSQVFIIDPESTSNPAPTSDLTNLEDLIQSQNSTNQIPTNVTQLAGSGKLHTWLLNKTPSSPLNFYDFSGKSTPTVPNISFRPGLIINKTIISISMDKDVYPVDSHTVQAGIKPHSRGKLLPGFTTTKNDKLNVILIRGISFQMPTPLPENLMIDSDSFISEVL